jgi:cation diffusion facilitator CzcD-associated flavoprotein CzcO
MTTISPATQLTNPFSYDFQNKKIGVIGAGSSAIQIVPSLQKLPGTQLSCFVRSQTWISPPFGQQLWGKLNLKSYSIPEEMRIRFQNDPKALLDFRLAVEEDGNDIHGVTMRGHPLQVDGKEIFKKHMESILGDTHAEILDSILPSFSPGCRRLTPGLGFLEALTQSNVDFVSTEIQAIESHGVRTKDGKLHEIDALVCATGFYASQAPPFPIRGQDGVTIKDLWESAGRPTNYLSLATSKMPNSFFMLGPNAAIGSGSLTMMIESVGDYIVKCIRKVQKENIRSMTVKDARVKDFMEYADRYFEGTVFSENCNSWYKVGSANGNKVTGLWPGSTLHCIEAMRSPRWEDYEYIYAGEEEGNNASTGQKKEVNRMAWLGSGWSVNQLDHKHLAWYLYPEFQDIPKPQRPEENERFAIRPFSY